MAKKQLTPEQLAIGTTYIAGNLRPATGWYFVDQLGNRLASMPTPVASEGYAKSSLAGTWTIRYALENAKVYRPTPTMKLQLVDELLRLGILRLVHT